MKKLKILFIIGALSGVAAISSFSLASDINPQLSIDGNKNSLSADINLKSDLSKNLDKEFKKKIEKKIEIKSKEEIIEDLKKIVNYNNLSKDQKKELETIIQEYTKKISEIIKDFSIETEDLTQDMVDAKYQKVLNKYVKKYNLTI